MLLRLPAELIDDRLDERRDEDRLRRRLEPASHDLRHAQQVPEHPVQSLALLANVPKQLPPGFLVEPLTLLRQQVRPAVDRRQWRPELGGGKREEVVLKL